MDTQHNYHIPQEGIKGLKQHWKADLLSSVFVFVMALPFCLSVAFGADLPIMSGVVTALVGGLLINFMGGAVMSIKMPTIGLIPIIIWGIHHLGGEYQDISLELWLAVLVLAGIVQILIGLLRIGDYLALIPDVVIYGLLSTIAIDIFVRQLHYLVGVVPSAETTFGLLLEFPINLVYLSKPDLVFISVICLGILFFSTTYRKRHESLLPVTLTVLVVGALMAWYLGIANKHGVQYLVALPQEGFIYQYQLPDFERIYTWEALEVALVVALFSSLESLLNVKSVEAIDFYRRKSKPNRELIALGLGNVLCGFLGGMPMSSSMTQSATSINSGAKTRWAGFFVALYLGAFLVLFASLVSVLPWVVFSAILVYLAHSLLSKKLIQNIKGIGNDQLIIYLSTMFFTLLGGMLTGLIVGWIISLGISLYLGASLKHLFRADIKIASLGENKKKIMVKSAALASNYLNIYRQIASIEEGNQIYLHLSKADVIDYSFLELVYQHPYNYNTSAGSIEIQGIEDHKIISAHPLSTRVIKDKSRKNRNIDENLTRFNERQLDVLSVASINNAKLRPHLTYDAHKLQGFSFSLGYDLKYRENKFSKNYVSAHYAKSTKIEFSDVFLSRGLRMSEQSRHVSVILVTDLQCHLPNFNLDKEGILSKMLQTVGYKDINFEHFPRFSEHYLLKGRDEKAIRALFNDELLTFFEIHDEFSVECKFDKILIHKEMDLMNRTEMEDAIVFVEQLLQLLYQETTQTVEALEASY